MMIVIIFFLDLKPQNIGFTADNHLKLLDFGLATCVKKSSSSSEAYKLTGYTGTRAYMAPEVALRLQYNEKVDIYSFGILFWQILSGEVPFQNMSKEEHMKKVSSCEIFRFHFKVLIPHIIVVIVQGCNRRVASSSREYWRLLRRSLADP